MVVLAELLFVVTSAVTCGAGAWFGIGYLFRERERKEEAKKKKQEEERLMEEAGKGGWPETE